MKTTERPPRQNLVKKYRPIGPAAIAAAVHAMMQKRKPKSANGHDATSPKRPASSVRRRANHH